MPKSTYSLLGIGMRSISSNSSFSAPSSISLSNADGGRACGLTRAHLCNIRHQKMLGEGRILGGASPRGVERRDRTPQSRPSHRGAPQRRSRATQHRRVLPSFAP